MKSLFLLAAAALIVTCSRVAARAECYGVTVNVTS